MTALVVHPGVKKPGIQMTALADQTGVRQHGTQEAPTLGAGTVPIPGRVKTAAKVETETAANHAAESTLVGGTEFFKHR